MTDYSAAAEVAKEGARTESRVPGPGVATRGKSKLKAQGGSLSARKNLSMVLRQWHQRAGLFSFLFMAWLGFSGVLLNQSASWGLDAIRVKSEALMAMYGLYAQVPESGYFSSGHWLVSTTENTVIDGQALEQHIPSPLGFVAIDSMGSRQLYVATKEKLTLADGDGNVIDEISDYMLPVAAIQQIGLLPASGDQPARLAVQGGGIYGTSDGMSWNKIESPEQVQWSSLKEIDDGMKAQVLPFAKPTVALEQVIIDLHSGRLFGWFGPYVINAVGVACIWLSVSGVWMMWRNKRRRR